MKKLYHEEGCCCSGCAHDHEKRSEHSENELHNHEHCECGHTHSEGENIEDGEDPHHHHHHEHGCCDHDHATPESKPINKANYRFKVKNLDCANCAMKVESEIKKQEGIQGASLSFSTELLLIQSNLEEQPLLTMLNQLADQVEPGVKIVSAQEKSEEKQNHNFEILQLIIGGLGFFIALYLEKSTTIDPLFMYLVVYLIVGYKVLYIAFRNILKGQIFDENFLMSVATLGAIYTGSYEEAVAVMLFYDLGELFQSIAVHRSRRSISELMDIHSDTATILRDGKEVVVKPEDIQVSDVLVVKAGERIAVDGNIIQGSTSLDVSALTGESLPKDVEVGDEVLAGSLNIQGLFTMKASKLAGESTVSRILELVESASSKKAKIEKFITRFAKIYTPLVVLAAIIIAIIPPLMGWGSFDTWIYRGCTFLVISCPCALVISVPLGLFAGIGAASRKGVLVKGGNYLELLSDMDTLILDKTGTITKGIFKVQKSEGTDNLLQLAAHGESFSNHPIAKSIVNAFEGEIDSSRMSEYREVAGQGIEALYDGQKLLVGNEKLLKENNIEFTPSSDLGSIIYVAYEGKYQGYIVVNDEIKDTTIEAMETLKQQGIKKTIMLTGDKKEIAEMIAKSAHIDEVHAQLLPQDKVSILEKYLQGENHKVGFVGDGINDAPVLMRADIGIAMGGIGSDAAVEASDIVLMNDDLLSISSAMKIAKKTKKILWQNISFSLLVKLVVLILTVFGITNMWTGVFADVGVTLIAVINAMRALKA